MHGEEWYSGSQRSDPEEPRVYRRRTVEFLWNLFLELNGGAEDGETTDSA